MAKLIGYDRVVVGGNGSGSQNAVHSGAEHGIGQQNGAGGGDLVKHTGLKLGHGLAEAFKHFGPGNVLCRDNGAPGGFID